jgi:hypothetical protein
MKKREEKIEKNLKNALGSLKVEGMYPTDAEIENVKARLRGDITQEQFMDNAEKIAKRGKKNNG